VKTTKPSPQAERTALLYRIDRAAAEGRLSLADESRNRRGCRCGLHHLLVRYQGSPGVFAVVSSRWDELGNLRVDLSAPVRGQGPRVIRDVDPELCTLVENWPPECCRPSVRHQYNRRRGRGRAR
jgi:hypothetical protein